MKRQSQSKLAFTIFFVVSSLLFLGCAKKDSEDKNKLQRSQVKAPNSNLPNINSARTINVSGSQSAVDFAAVRNARLEWLQTYEPVDSNSNSEIVVVNVFEVNGIEYDVPTFHPRLGGSELRGTQETYEVDDLLVHTDSACLNSFCDMYVASVVLSRDGEALTQNLVFVDFNGRNQPYYLVNQPEDMLSLGEFVDLLYGY